MRRALRGIDEQIAGPMKLTELTFAFGYMVGGYEAATVVPGGNAYWVFAVGGISSGNQRFSEAMREPAGGAPVTGGTCPASAAGARGHLTLEHPRAIARTR